MSVLEVKNLRVTFRQDGRLIEAVKGVSFTVDKGETVALVGESGSGKSVTALSTVGLLADTAAVTGSVTYSGTQMIGASERALRRVRGNDISFIFQEPMTSLNPLHTIEKQLAESLALHQGLTGDAARPGVTGQFSLVGPKLRETLSWLAVDVSSVPPSKLQKLSLRGRMSSTGGNVQVSDAVFELDDLKGSGGVTVTFTVPLSIVTSVSLDTLDLDSFLVPAAAQPKPAAAPGAAAPSAALAVAGPSVGLKAKVARLIYNKETIQGVDVDVALHLVCRISQPQPRLLLEPRLLPQPQPQPAPQRKLRRSVPTP